MGKFEYIKVNESPRIKYEKYLDLFCKYDLLFVKSPTGSCKTTMVVDLVKKLNINVLSIVSRQTLAGQHNQLFGLKGIDIKNYLCLDANFNVNNLVICFDSLPKLYDKLDNFKNCIVYLDF